MYREHGEPRGPGEQGRLSAGSGTATLSSTLGTWYTLDMHLLRDFSAKALEDAEELAAGEGCGKNGTERCSGQRSERLGRHR